MEKEHDSLTRIRLSEETEKRLQSLQRSDPVFGAMSLPRLCNFLIMDKLVEIAAKRKATDESKAG